jgi:hypothetical protein
MRFRSSSMECDVHKKVPMYMFYIIFTSIVFLLLFSLYLPLTHSFIVLYDFTVVVVVDKIKRLY